MYIFVHRGVQYVYYSVRCNIFLFSSCSPLLADDFLSELDLKTVYCNVGGQPLSGPIRSRYSTCIMIVFYIDTTSTILAFWNNRKFEKRHLSLLNTLCVCFVCMFSYMRT